jgi:hypothetical protein
MSAGRILDAISGWNMDDAQRIHERPANVSARTTLDWGALRRTQPIGRRLGFDRGQPILKKFVAARLLL